MNSITLIGIIAAVLTTSAYVPQALKTIRTRSTHDLSLPTFSLLFLGTVLWFIYGLLLKDTPMIFANSITAGLTGVILCLKLTTKK